MVIYSIDYWDDWMDMILRSTEIENWWFEPTYCTFHTNAKYGDGKQWWMTLGPGGHWYFDADNVYTLGNGSLHKRLAREIKELVFVTNTN